MNKKEKEQGSRLGLLLSRILFGVNLKFFCCNVVLCVLCVLICICTQTFWGVPVSMIVHILAVRLSIKEPDYFYLDIQSLIKTPPLLNRW